MGGVRKHVSEELNHGEGKRGKKREREREKKSPSQRKTKNPSAFHYNHTANSTFPLCFNYLSVLIKTDSLPLNSLFQLPPLSVPQRANRIWGGELCMSLLWPTESQGSFNMWFLSFKSNAPALPSGSFLMLFLWWSHSSYKLLNKWSFSSITKTSMFMYRDMQIMSPGSIFSKIFFSVWSAGTYLLPGESECGSTWSRCFCRCPLAMELPC